MKRIRLVLLILGTTLWGYSFAASENAAEKSGSHCQAEVFEAEDHCFALGTLTLPFQEARMYCVKTYVGGELANLHREGDWLKVVQYLRYHFSHLFINNKELDEVLANLDMPSNSADTLEVAGKDGGNPSDNVKAMPETRPKDSEVEIPDSLAVTPSPSHPPPENKTNAEEPALNRSATLKKREVSKPGGASNATNSRTTLDRKSEVASLGSTRLVTPLNSNNNNNNSNSSNNNSSSNDNHNDSDGGESEDGLSSRVESARQEVLLARALLTRGVWLGAYRKDDSPMFAWFRQTGFLVRSAPDGANCLILGPKEDFQIKGANCSVPRLPLCQLLSCPKSHCRNGGRCHNGSCYCPDPNWGDLCEILSKKDGGKAQVIPVGARTVPGVDEGHRNLFIALLVAVGVASLFIVLVLSKDRINQFLQRQRRSNMAMEEGPAAEAVPITTTTLNEAAVEMEEIDVSGGLASASTEQLAGDAEATESKADSTTAVAAIAVAVVEDVPLPDPTPAKEEE